jgi:hypothetical protein
MWPVVRKRRFLPAIAVSATLELGRLRRKTFGAHLDALAGDGWSAICLAMPGRCSSRTAATLRSTSRQPPRGAASLLHLREALPIDASPSYDVVVSRFTQLTKIPVNRVMELAALSDRWDLTYREQMQAMTARPSGR